MFDWLFVRLELNKLNRRWKKLVEEGRRLYGESKTKNDANIFGDWLEEHRSEFESIRWARKDLISQALLMEADRISLPRPQYSDKSKWESPDKAIFYGENLVLTIEAMAELRGAIRKERRERRETFESWAKIISSLVAILTGLVGALIGLFSILKHR